MNDQELIAAAERVADVLSEYEFEDNASEAPALLTTMGERITALVAALAGATEMFATLSALGATPEQTVAWGKHAVMLFAVGATERQLNAACKIIAAGRAAAETLDELTGAKR